MQPKRIKKARSGIDTYIIVLKFIAAKINFTIFRCWWYMFTYIVHISWLTNCIKLVENYEVESTAISKLNSKTKRKVYLIHKFSVLTFSAIFATDKKTFKLKEKNEKK